MMVICEQCGNEWNYTGKSNYGAQCPECKHTTKFLDRILSKQIAEKMEREKAGKYPKIKSTPRLTGKVNIKTIFKELKKNPINDDELLKIADKDDA